MIAHEENSEHALHSIRNTLRQQGIQDSNRLTIHSDLGSLMQSGGTIELNGLEKFTKLFP